MSEPLSEAAGCALLARLFRARGYAIRRNVRFDEPGVSFDIDGWDASARVGFEFLSSEKEDHDDLSLREFERLKDAERRGELFVFVVDEAEPLSAAALRASADAFLDEVAARTSSRRGSAARAPGKRVTRKAVRTPAPRRPATKTPATKKSVTTKPAAKKPAAKKHAGKKPAAKKSVAKKTATGQSASQRPAVRTRATTGATSRPATRTIRRRG
jgi:hypothetical protein